MIGMNRKRLLRLLGTLTIVALLLGVPSIGIVAAQDPVPLDEGVDLPRGDEVAVLPFAKVSLINGTEVEFYEFPDSDGSTMVAVSQLVPANAHSIFEVEGLVGREVSAVTIFYAITDNTVQCPRQFAAECAAPHDQPRGWAIREFNTLPAGTDWCNLESFKNNILQFDLESQHFRSNERPIDHPERWPSYLDTFDGFFTKPYDATWHRYAFSKKGVEKLYTGMAMCESDVHPEYWWGGSTPDGGVLGGYTDHLGPTFRIKGVANGKVYTPVNNIDMSVGGLKTWLFTGSNIDTWIEIRLAKPLDKFHIGVAWEDLF